MGGTSWPVLPEGQNARSADVSARFDWIVGHLMPQLAGNETTATFDLGTTTTRWDTIYVSDAIDANGGIIAGTSASEAIMLATGTSVNEFSTDNTLGDNSDLAVPTEKAVKAYIDRGLVSNYDYAAQGPVGTSYTEVDLSNLLATLTITTNGYPVMITGELSEYDTITWNFASGFYMAVAGAVFRDGSLLTETVFSLFQQYGNTAAGGNAWSGTTQRVDYSILMVDTPPTAGTYVYTLRSYGTTEKFTFKITELKH